MASATSATGRASSSSGPKFQGPSMLVRAGPTGVLRSRDTHGEVPTRAAKGESHLDSGVQRDRRSIRHPRTTSGSTRTTLGPVSTPDHIARSHRRNSCLMSVPGMWPKEAPPHRAHGEFHTPLACAVRIPPAERIYLCVPPLRFNVLVAFVASHNHHRLHTGTRSDRVQQRYCTEDVRRERSNGGLHRKLGPAIAPPCEKTTWWFERPEYLAEPVLIIDIEELRPYRTRQLQSLEHVRVRVGRQGQSRRSLHPAHLARS